MSKTVSVAIATYNRFEALRQTLEDLSRQTRPPEEIIVVDQSHDDGGRPFDRGAELTGFANLTYIHQAKPNAQRARNHAIVTAAGEILIFVDDDVRLPPGFVAAHLRNYEEDPTLDGVTGQTLEPGQQPTCDLPASFHWPTNGWQFLPLNYAKRDYVVNWPSCNASVRRTLALAVGGFDEQFRRTWWDDSDFSWRLHKAGARIVFDPEASLLHLKVSSGGKRPRGAGAHVWADRDYWATLFYYWRKNFGLLAVWRHVWWWLRHMICRKALLRRPHWLLLNVYHCLAGYFRASRALRQGPHYLKTTQSDVSIPALALPEKVSLQA